MTRYFGRDFGAPMYRDAKRVPVPVGQRCAHCEEPFIEGDDGIITGAFRDCAPDRPVPGSAPFHRACFLRGIIGSVAHIERRCSCFVPGSDDGDPPDMTRREAAEAAVAAHERQSVTRRLNIS